MSLPLTLAIDTCLPACSVAIAFPNGHVVTKSDEIGVGHAEHVGGIVTALLDDAAVKPADIGRVAATVGPGSFMGVRVGVSFAKGFAFARTLPTIPLNTLEALWLSQAESEDGYAVIDAKRGQVYLQGFGATHVQPSLLSVGEARDLVDGSTDVRVVGSGAVLVCDRDSQVLFPDIGAVARACQIREPQTLSPLYLRAPDAKPPKSVR